VRGALPSGETQHALKEWVFSSVKSLVVFAGTRIVLVVTAVERIGVGRAKFGGEHHDDEGDEEEFVRGEVLEKFQSPPPKIAKKSLAVVPRST
jgi:hypothetical protein